MRKKIVAGNWKMNLNLADAKVLVNEISIKSSAIENVDIMIFPTIMFTIEIAKNKENLILGVQNFYPIESGAFTGEVSVTQVKDCGATHVLIGHSERRAIFSESNELLKQKVDAAIKHGLVIVFCCGEPLEIRENGNELEYVKNQLLDSLFHLSAAVIEKCIIAYEPVWAIGTGVTASIQQAEDMHFAIRGWIKEQYSQKTADSISILYGGSCNASNAKELFACPNVDGGLIGGASLQADSFIIIASSF